MPTARRFDRCSPERLAKGSMAITGRCTDRPKSTVWCGRPSDRQLQTRIGRVMFLRCCSPRSSNASAILPCSSSNTFPDTHTPPGSARLSRRTATLTPFPRRSPSSATSTSPRLIPMRSRTRRSSGWLSARSPTSLCTSTAQVTASTGLGNSISAPSPVVLIKRPECRAAAGATTSDRTMRIAASAACSSVSTIRDDPTTSVTKIAAKRRVIMREVRLSQPL